MRYLLCLLALGLSIQAYADNAIIIKNPLDVKISDGDTLSFRMKGDNVRVRLVGIDAPESKQHYGRESAAQLKHCLQGNDIKVTYKKKDGYGRLLGKLVVDGRDCNYNQVASGAAWWYEDFANEQNIIDRQKYSHAHNYAKFKKLGLWGAGDVVKPSEYRKANK